MLSKDEQELLSQVFPGYQFTEQVSSAAPERCPHGFMKEVQVFEKKDRPEQLAWSDRRDARLIHEVRVCARCKTVKYNQPTDKLRFLTKKQWGWLDKKKRERANKS